MGQSPKKRLAELVGLGEGLVWGGGEQISRIRDGWGKANGLDVSSLMPWHL